MQNKKSGFTLIELLVVIAIIGILSGIVLVGLNMARDRARDTRVKGELANLRASMELYYADNKTYYINSDNRACISANATKLIESITEITPSVNCEESPDGSGWYAMALLPSSSQVIFVQDENNQTIVNPDLEIWCVDGSGFSGPLSGANLAPVINARSCRAN